MMHLVKPLQSFQNQKRIWARHYPKVGHVPLTKKDSFIFKNISIYYSELSEDVYNFFLDQIVALPPTKQKKYLLRK